MSFCFLISFLILQYVGAVPRVDPLVDSKVGLIRGVAAEDGDYSMFLGIPYAKVEEDNPFGPSIPYPDFEDTFEAYDDSAICPQIEEFDNTIVGNLDCLHLNVYVPNTATSTNPLPVLVWIYGGGFEIGFAGRYLYGPNFLVRHGIVLVTINYRLGPYGFMCLDTPSVSGNQGLKDQLLALRWIKNNIEAFGGDANKITIFGESAGSVSVDSHIHSVQEDLFHQAIFQSGTMQIPSLIDTPSAEGPIKLAEYLGFGTGDVNDALSFLATVDTSLVIAASNELNIRFGVCIENNFDGVENFISDYPINLPVPKIKNIPILIGFNNDEWLSTYAHADDDFFRQSTIVSNYVKYNFDFVSDNELNEMIDFVRHFYMGDEEESVETRRQIINLASDFDFYHPTRRTIQKYFENGAQTIFSYVFSYDGQRNFVKYRSNITFGGAAHADEISYLFDVSFLKSIMPQEDQVIVDRITTLWANFVKYGHPTPETTDLLPINWTPTTKERWNYLNIDSELTMENRPFNDRMAFLDLFYKMNEKYQRGYRDN